MQAGKESDMTEADLIALQIKVVALNRIISVMIIRGATLPDADAAVVKAAIAMYRDPLDDEAVKLSDDLTEAWALASGGRKTDG